MQITSQAKGNILEMRVAGRLDNDGAGHLTTAIDEAIRLGSHSIALDLEDVKYISSAGIGTLIKAHKQFQAIRGHFAIAAASPEVTSVIRLTGLSEMLLQDRTEPFGMASLATMSSAPGVSYQSGMTYELYNIKPVSRLTCEVIGSPASLSRGNFADSQCHTVEFPASTVGLGLGAFGHDYNDCSNRFGEFLAAGGASAQQPTNGTRKPDYQRVIGDFVPRVQMLYGLRCQGEFSQFVRFDPDDDDARLTLSSLVDQLLTLSESDLVAMVFLAESSGLIGARLRCSPAAPIEKAASGDIDGTRFSHPEVRRWLSFTPDRSFSHSLALVVGVAGRGEMTGNAKLLKPLVRPLAPGSDLVGHFHAATLSYRPFKKRRLDLNETVAALCESEDLQAVLHLLHDDREITGGGESEFVRGACWVGPIGNVIEQGH